MRIFLGILIGLFLAVGIAVAAAYMAFGELTNIGERDKSKDVVQRFDFQDFDKIDIAGVYELNVSVGGDFSIEISGAPEEMARLEASVENQTLMLGREERNMGPRGWRNQGLTAEISLPALSAIDIAGVVDADVRGVDAETFAVDIAGVGDLDISGSCDSLEADVAGIGDFNAEDLRCRAVTVQISGIGDASVYAGEEVDAEVSGIGDIDIYGSPEIVRKEGGLFSDITVR